QRRIDEVAIAVVEGAQDPKSELSQHATFIAVVLRIRARNERQVMAPAVTVFVNDSAYHRPIDVQVFLTVTAPPDWPESAIGKASRYAGDHQYRQLNSGDGYSISPQNEVAHAVRAPLAVRKPSNLVVSQVVEFGCQPVPFVSRQRVDVDLVGSAVGKCPAGLFRTAIRHSRRSIMSPLGVNAHSNAFRLP